jgi:hypothetical protein
MPLPACVTDIRARNQRSDRLWHFFEQSDTRPTANDFAHAVWALIDFHNPEATLSAASLINIFKFQ